MSSAHCTETRWAQGFSKQIFLPPHFTIVFYVCLAENCAAVNVKQNAALCV